MNDFIKMQPFCDETYVDLTKNILSQLAIFQIDFMLANTRINEIGFYGCKIQALNLGYRFYD